VDVVVVNHQIEEIRERLQSLVEFVLREVVHVALSEAEAKWELTVSAKGSDIAWKLSQFGKMG